MPKIINLTPHIVRTLSGGVFKSGGTARVSTEFRAVAKVNKEILYKRDDVLDLPEPKAGVFYIVSAITLAVAKAQGRTDCLSPAVFHKSAKRNQWGKIVVVPGFIF